MKNEINEQSIHKINRVIKGSYTADDRCYHKAKLLLKLYRTVVWRVSSDLYEIQDRSAEWGSSRISDLIDYLDLDFDEHTDKRDAANRLRSICETNDLVNIVDQALLKIRTYPGHGELYFTILTKQYINLYAMAEQELLSELCLERSTYYRRKKEALNLIGVILWGFILPELRSVWQPLRTQRIAEQTAYYNTSEKEMKDVR
jgi:hypothetical protein